MIHRTIKTKINVYSYIPLKTNNNPKFKQTAYVLRIEY